MTDKHTCDGLGSGRVGAGCGTMAVCVAPKGHSAVRYTNGPYATVSGPEGSPWKGAAPAGGWRVWRTAECDSRATTHGTSGGGAGAADGTLTRVAALLNPPEQVRGIPWPASPPKPASVGAVKTWASSSHFVEPVDLRGSLAV
jgi:hypothetical protein